MPDLAASINGASDSIWVRSSFALLRASGIVDSYLRSVAASLDLRCLLEQPGFEGGEAPPSELELDPFLDLDVFSINQPFPDDSIATSYDWEYRWLQGEAQSIQLIIDSKLEFTIRPHDGRFFVTDGRKISASDRAVFKTAWEKALLVGNLYDAEEAEFEIDEEDEENPILGAPYDWKSFLEKIHKDPSALFQMSPRDFEQFVADLLDEDGFDVRLTPYSKDGGVDIIANRAGLVNELYLVQCKRAARRRPVGVDVVRSLYGVVHRDRATAGLIVTSSRLTRDAKSECKKLEHQMSFREYDDLVKWIARITRK